MVRLSGTAQFWFSFAFLIALAIRPAAAFAPDSPEVKKLIDRGIKYLEDKTDPRVGGKCLIGMAFLKHLHDVDHPKVKEAVEACQNVCKAEAKDIAIDMYSTGIAIIFLCEVDPYKYRPEIEKLLASMNFRQKVHGGYGYPLNGATHPTTGDTSMTQYAVLSSWAAARSGIPVQISTVENVCNWLLLTQDPQGGWGYQGKVAESTGKRLEQDGVRLSLSAAGLGSTYICADLLGFTKAMENEEVRLEGLPPAVKLVKEDKPVVALTDRVDVKAMRDSMRLGNGWFSKNYKIEYDGWQHYYLYALERYQSFRELAEGRSVKEPGWYNDGVRLLRDTIAKDGSWSGPQQHPMPEVNTAFGLLFLMRSTKKTIEKSVQLAAEGTLVAGRGLPTTIIAVRVRDGKVVAAAPEKSTTELLTALEDPEAKLTDLVDAVGQLELSSDAAEQKAQIARLTRITQSGTPEAKILAVRTLGKTRQFDLAPTLIRAVRDTDPRVSLEAHLALKQLSRKLRGIELVNPNSATERAEAAKAWRDWYASVRPDADMDD